MYREEGREGFNVGSDENIGFGKFYEMPVVCTELSVRRTKLLCVNNLSIFCRIAANYGKAQFWKPRVTPTLWEKGLFSFSGRQRCTSGIQLTVGNRTTTGTAVNQNSSFSSLLHCALEKVSLPAKYLFSLPHRVSIGSSEVIFGGDLKNQ